jgi:hypothetical protein
VVWSLRPLDWPSAEGAIFAIMLTAVILLVTAATLSRRRRSDRSLGLPLHVTEHD